jgi:hypothetical protein
MFRKRFSKYFLAASLCLLLAVVVVHLYWLDGLTGAALELLFGQTSYSKMYREYRFRQVSIGMGESEVLRILGEPLSADRQDGVWRFATMSSQGRNRDGFPDACFTYRIVFFSNGVVVRKEHGFHWD